MIKKTSYTFLLLILTMTLAYSLDPFHYTVDVKNFNEEIYRQKTSRFRLDSSDQEFSLAENRRQSVTRSMIKDGRKILDIRTGEAGRGTDRTPAGGGYLKDTRFLNLTSPEISGAAARLGTAKDPVRAVEAFVYRHISTKTLGIPLAAAAQVYRMKTGDCTEHSVLAVALLRKLGVPARAIVGMYLADDFLGNKNVFVYHMWAEAYQNGSWRLVDATRPGGAGLNRYIAFAEHNLRAEAPLPYLRAISAIQDLTVEYLGK